MTGGQIFHTLMVQHGVKQICESFEVVVVRPSTEIANVVPVDFL